MWINPEFPIASTFQPKPWQVPVWNCKDPVMLLTGSAGGGKALALDTEIPTVDGWKRMKEIQVGDVVFDETGAPTRVVAVSDVIEGAPCFRIQFSGGESVVCDSRHLWNVDTASKRGQYTPVRTIDMAKGVKIGLADRLNYSVPLTLPVFYPERELPVPPYLLGVILGDGSIKTGGIKFTSSDDSIIEEVRKDAGQDYCFTVRHKGNCVDVYIRSALGRIAHQRKKAKGYTVSFNSKYQKWYGTARIDGQYKFIGDFISKEEAEAACINYKGERYSESETLGTSLLEGFKLLGLMGADSHTKFIPDIYKTACLEDRLSLLQGLMDTDGSIDKTRGRVEYTTVSNHLAFDVYELCCSVGIKAFLTKRYVKYQGTRVPCWRIQFTSSINVFKLERKRKHLKQSGFRSTQSRRYIEKIEAVESLSVKCLQVEAESHQYLITRSYIPTHNSVIASEKLHGLAMAYPGVSCLIVRRVQASMKNTVLTPLERRVMGDGHGIEHEKGAKRYMYPNGSAIFYLGVKDDESLERLKGIGLEGGIEFLWIEEANELRSRDAFSALLARMRGIFAPWTQVILTCNPDSDQHWIYQDLMLGRQATVFYSSIDDNDSSPEIYRRNLSQMTGIQADRLRDGKWVHITGGIYPEYKAELHVVPNALMGDPRSRINHTWTVEAGVDWGFAHAGVIGVWAYDDHDRAFLIHECVRRQQTIDFWVAEAKYLQQRFRIRTFYCDPSKPDNIQKFKQAGLNAVRAKNSFYAGRDEVKRRLKPGIDGLPSFFICAGATDKDEGMEKERIPCGLGEEITGYKYDKPKFDQPNEEPLKIRDDSCDAARYALYSHSLKPSRDTFRASDAGLIVDPVTELRRLTQTMQGQRLIQKQF